MPRWIKGNGPFKVRILNSDIDGRKVQSVNEIAALDKQYAVQIVASWGKRFRGTDKSQFEKWEVRDLHGLHGYFILEYAKAH